jgi:uncharacterized protein YuzB (UPF0349 family)
MTPSVHQQGESDTGGLSWEEKLVLEKDESTAVACIRGIQCEGCAREVLGVVNREGVEGAVKARVVERVQELAD